MRGRTVLAAAVLLAVLGPVAAGLPLGNDRCVSGTVSQGVLEQGERHESGDCGVPSCLIPGQPFVGEGYLVFLLETAEPDDVVVLTTYDVDTYRSVETAATLAEPLHVVHASEFTANCPTFAVEGRIVRDTAMYSVAACTHANVPCRALLQLTLGVDPLE